MSNTKRVIILVLTLVVAFVIGTMSPPHEAMNQASMRFLGIFVAMLIMLISRVIEDWVASFFVLVALIVFKVAELNVVLAPFGQSTIWLMIGVLAMATGISNSGLLKRIATKILTLFPATYKGMILAMMSSGVAITPLVSSVIGKGTLMAPVATTVSEQAGLQPGGRAALGLFSATFFTSYIAGSAFLSGSGYPAFLLGLMPGVKMAWMDWFVASSVWFLFILLGTYIFCMTYCKPKPGEMVELDPELFKARYAELGPITNNEKYAVVVVLITLTLWITQSIHGIDAGTVAVLAVAAFGAYGLLPVKDFVARTPWPLVVFVGMLLSASSFITSLGVGKWIAFMLGPILAPVLSSPWIFIPVLCITVFLLRFVIISMLAMLAIIFAIFGPLVGDAGISMYVLLFSGFMCCNVWNTKYQASVILPVWAAGGGKYVPYEMFSKSSIAYMVMCIVGLTASIPLWQMLGLIK